MYIVPGRARRRNREKRDKAGQVRHPAPPPAAAGALNGGVANPIPILLLPGLHGTCSLLQPLARALGAERPVIAIDYPPDELLGYEALAALVLRQAPPGPLVVLGESFSGPLAIRLAQREPRFAGLILASTFARFPLPRPLAPAAAWLTGLPVSPRLPARVLAGPGATPALVAELTSLIAALPKATVRHRTRVALGIDVRSALASTRCPLLCLTGHRDRLTGRRALASITRARPDAEVRLLDAGHMLLETRAEAAAVAIESFCARLSTHA